MTSSSAATAEATANAILAGDIPRAARLMRDLDDVRPGAVEIMKHLYPHTGRAFVLGIIVPAAIVFAAGPRRWLGVLMVLAMIAAWRPVRSSPEV